MFHLGGGLFVCFGLVLVWLSKHSINEHSIQPRHNITIWKATRAEGEAQYSRVFFHIKLSTHTMLYFDVLAVCVQWFSFFASDKLTWKVIIVSSFQIPLSKDYIRSVFFFYEYTLYLLTHLSFFPLLFFLKKKVPSTQKPFSNTVLVNQSLWHTICFPVILCLLCQFQPTAQNGPARNTDLLPRASTISIIPF